MKIQIKKSEFRKLYQKLTNKEVAKHYGVSNPTIVNWAKKLGLSKKNSKRYEFVD